MPYDNYRNSLITVTRTSQITNRDSLRRSKLFESFSQNNTNPEEFKDLNVNTIKMLDFFGVIGKKVDDDSAQVSKENNA